MKRNQQPAASAHQPCRRISLIAIGLLVFTLTGVACQRASDKVPEKAADAGDPGVTGLGGLFFRSDDPTAIRDWYRTHLGIDSQEWGGYAFQWEEKESPGETGYTVWGAFPDTTNYFAPSQHSFMVNFRVRDLTTLIERLKADGVEIIGEIEKAPNGKFAWILDPEGRKVELWEPVPSSEDPYL